MSIIGNGTTGASGTGPASGYNLELSHLLVVFFLFLYRFSVNTSNPYDAIMLLISTHSMICFMIFGIKICHKMPKNLTIKNLIAVIGFRSLVLLLRLSQMFLMDQITNDGVIG
jgi:hypothetical protein